MRAQVDARRSMADIARQLGCSTRSVRAAAARVGRVATPRPPRWLTDQLTRRPIPVVAAELGVSSERVSAAARRHGITIPPGPRIKFPELRDPDWLRSRSHRTIAEVADELGCSTHTVEKAVTRTGVRLGQPSRSRVRTAR